MFLAYKITMDSSANEVNKNEQHKMQSTKCRRLYDHFSDENGHLSLWEYVQKQTFCMWYFTHSIPIAHELI